MKRNKSAWLFSLMVVFALVLTACGGGATPTEAVEPTEAMEEPMEEPTADEGEGEAMDMCMGAAAGEEVTILYQWSGVEEENFTAAIAPVVEACGITVVAESSRDQALLQTRIESGDPWDIVIWPTRGPALSYSDMLQPLDAVGADASNYADALVAAGSSDSTWITIPVKVQTTIVSMNV